jgi:ribosomal protein L13
MRTKAATVRTYTPKPADIERRWHVIDATDVVLGRLASQAAQLLRGKHKPIFAPHIDTGDFVIVINADKVALTGSKRDQKVAYRHSGYRAVCVPSVTRSCWRSILSVLSRRLSGHDSKNTLGRQQLSKLKVYRGGVHRMRRSSRSPSPFRRSRSSRHPGLDRREELRRTVAETMGEIEDEVLDAETRQQLHHHDPEVRGGGLSITAPGAATGRRKEAIARVRLVPGSGQWKINGRVLEDYFPNKVHQQLVSEPFRVTDLESRFDVIVRIHGGGSSGQAGALRLGIARALNGIDTDANRPTLEEGWFPHSGRAGQRA